MWVIDGNNVLGAGADRWWADPTSAGVRLADAVARWRRVEDVPVVLVFDGRPEPRLLELAEPGLEIDFATRSGRDAADDRIVEIVDERFADHPDLTVATSDRGLADRLPPGVAVEGAGRFRTRLGLPGPGRHPTRRQ